MARKKKMLALAVALMALAAVVSACGEDESDTSTDAAFVQAMIPHHESAIEMAEIAQERAQRPQIEQLANDIVAAQSEEIKRLETISGRLGGEGSSLNMSSEDMGMAMDDSELESAEPFDRAFIDMMVAHHQGAIMMAREELANGNDDESRALAEEIIAAQSREIEQMNEWRKKWYGAPSPAGGVPEMSSSGMGGMEGMNH